MTIGLIANTDGSGAVQLGGINAISLDTSLNSTTAGSLNAPNTFGFKNRIINGGMVIDQRNAGASVTQTVAQTYVTDRFAIFGSVTSKFTAQRNAGSVTPPVGFTNYLGMTSSSAYNVQTTDYFQLRQTIEGFNVADLAWGTASAATITISFWVRSSLTGTFGGAVGNQAGNRSYPFTYTINAANTWEQKSITIAGDTTGTWTTDNTGGLWLYFGLGAGSTYSGTAGTWAAADYRSATGATSVVGTSGATFYITGVQLEKGSIATPFDFRDYGRELQLCQRYYQRLQGTASDVTVISSGAAWSTVTYYSVYPLLASMRVAPALSYSALSDFTLYFAGTTRSPTSLGTSAQANSIEIVAGFSTATTIGYAGFLRLNASASAYLALSAEL